MFSCFTCHFLGVFLLRLTSGDFKTFICFLFFLWQTISSSLSLLVPAEQIVNSIQKKMHCSQYNAAITEQSKSGSLIKVPAKEITYWSTWQILFSSALLIKRNNLQLGWTINLLPRRVWLEVITPQADTEKGRGKGTRRSSPYSWVRVAVLEAFCNTEPFGSLKQSQNSLQQPLPSCFSHTCSLCCFSKEMNERSLWNPWNPGSSSRSVGQTGMLMATLGASVGSAHITQRAEFL